MAVSRQVLSLLARRQQDPAACDHARADDGFLGTTYSQYDSRPNGVSLQQSFVQHMACTNCDVASVPITVANLAHRFARSDALTPPMCHTTLAVHQTTLWTPFKEHDKLHMPQFSWTQHLSWTQQLDTSRTPKQCVAQVVRRLGPNRQRATIVVSD